MAADIIQIPVGTRVAQAWVGVPSSPDQILFWNQDSTNIVYLGFKPQIAAAGPNTIPVPPNGSFQIAANRSVFAIGSVDGIKPVVVIPGGGMMFRGLTQGLGSLAIPSVFSPNFVHNVSGWSINEDGTLEANNGTFRGTVTASTIIGSVIQSLSLAPGVKIDANGNIIVFNQFGAIVLYIAPAKDGLFVYKDTGSATQGALIASTAGTTGTDPVNGTNYGLGTNTYVAIGATTYAVGLNNAGVASLVGFSIQLLGTSAPFQPAGVFGQADTTHAQCYLSSGAKTNTDSLAAILMQSQSQSGITGGLAQVQTGLMQVQGSLEVDSSIGTPTLPAIQSPFGGLLFTDQVTVSPMRYKTGTSGDGNTYALGKQTISGAPSQLFNNINPVQVGNINYNVIPGILYHVEVDIFYSSTATAGAPQFGWDGGSVANHVDGSNGWDDFQNVPVTGGYFVGSMGLQTGPTLSSGNHRYHTEFWITFTTGGNFNLRGQCTIAADTFTVLSYYARMEPT